VDWESNVKLGLALVMLEFCGLLTVSSITKREKEELISEMIHSCNMKLCSVTKVVLCDICYCLTFMLISK
jgi:hypothetical protein